RAAIDERSQNPSLQRPAQGPKQRDHGAGEETRSGAAHSQRRRGHRRLVPNGVGERAANKHVQKLAGCQTEHKLVFDGQMRWDVVLARRHLMPIAFCTRSAITFANRTPAKPPTAANAASLAVSMRRGLPPAVMYRKPAQARNRPAAAMPMVRARSVSLVNSETISGALIETNSVDEVRASVRRGRGRRR